MSTRALLGWAVAATAVFGVLTVLVVHAPTWLLDWDETLSADVRVAVRATPALAEVARVVTWLGGGWVVTGLVVVAGGALVLARRTPLAVVTACVVASSAVLNRLVKALLARERPAHPDALLSTDGWAFPSGHSQAAVVTWVMLLLVVGWATVLTGRLARVGSALVAVMVIGLVGWSRVALGVHWPSDVLGGWALGSAWVLGAAAALTHWRRGGGARSARADGAADADPDDAVRGSSTDPVGRRPARNGSLRRDDSGEPS